MKKKQTLYIDEKFIRKFGMENKSQIVNDALDKYFNAESEGYLGSSFKYFFYAPYMAHFYVISPPYRNISYFIVVSGLSAITRQFSPA